MKKTAIKNEVWTRRAIFCFLSLFLFVVTIISCVFTPMEAKAEDTGVSMGVLSDLEKSDNFDKSKYKAVANDPSLSVIQIAESANGCLYLYVYQPSNGATSLTASSVNISTEKDGANVKVYTLSLVDVESVFSKYKVEGLTVSKDDIRYYYIGAIYRPWNKTTDSAPTDDNVIYEVSYSVGQMWKVLTVGNSVSYEVKDVEFITIDQKHVGFIRYPDWKLFANYNNTDSHYVAFSTDREIDEILSAEIYFTTQTYYEETNSFFSWNNRTVKGPVTEEYRKLTDKDIFVLNSWFSVPYAYNRIQSMEEFLLYENSSLNSQTQEALQGKDWVFRFYESGNTNTAFTTTSADNIIQNTQFVTSYTQVSNVTILRLEYEYGGQVYSVGVIDDRTGGDKIPDGIHKNFPWWLVVLICVAVIVLVIVLVNIIEDIQMKQFMREGRKYFKTERKKGRKRK